MRLALILLATLAFITVEHYDNGTVVVTTDDEGETIEIFCYPVGDIIVCE